MCYFQNEFYHKHKTISASLCAREVNTFLLSRLGVGESNLKILHEYRLVSGISSLEHIQSALKVTIHFYERNQRFQNQFQNWGGGALPVDHASSLNWLDDKPLGFLCKLSRKLI